MRSSSLQYRPLPREPTKYLPLATAKEMSQRLPLRLSWRRAQLNSNPVIPDALPGSLATRRDYHNCIKAVRRSLPKVRGAELWDGRDLKNKLLETPPLALRYLTDCLPDGAARKKAVAEQRRLYDRELVKLHGKIQFVGMSVYKEEAAENQSSAVTSPFVCSSIL